MRHTSKLLPLLAALLALSACQAPPAALRPPDPAVIIPPTLSPAIPTSAAGVSAALAAAATASAPTATPAPTPVPGTTVWVDPLLPADIHDQLVARIGAFAQTTSGAEQVSLSANPAASVKISAGNDSPAIFTRTLVLAAPFATLADDVKLADLKRFWAGDGGALAGATNDGSTPTLFLDPDSRAALSLLLGPPAADARIWMLAPGELLSKTWEAHALAIVPFDALEVRWKALQIDGLNLFERETDMGKYPLSLRVALHGDAPTIARLRAALPPLDNRDPAQLAIVAMTGVTALVRGTAVRMEEKGVTYPGEKIRDWLKTADIAHISNEVSFYDKCRPPTRNDGTTMCSNWKYMDLLRYVGTDIVELTGNHTWDYGAANLIPTIEAYEKEGWKTFGGGRNLEESRKPAYMTVNGNKLAFIGCSSFGTNWASAERAGATPCGVDDPTQFDWMISAVKKARAEGYIVIATIQYTEFYHYEATPQQDKDFRAVRDAGASVVNGSQGHHVQGFDVSEAGFCHYGTGNLFFGDQTFIKGAQQTMVDRHVFYNGRYLGVDLRTANIEDISQPVPMNTADRRELLTTLFKVSGY